MQKMHVTKISSTSD